MRKLLWTVALTALVSFTTASVSAQAKPDSLYKRLGGYDAIAAVVDNFVPRMVKDPTLSKYFLHAENSLKRIRQLVVDQLCEATGGPCIYLGRDTKTSHKGLGITAAEWDTAVKHLVATLDQFKVPAKEKGELLTIAGSLRADIVEK